jgi:WD40 repeat protein
MPKSAVALAGTGINSAAADDNASARTAWVALANGDVQLLDTRAGTPTATKWTAGVAACAIAVSADGREVAFGAADGTAILFDVHGGSIRERWRRGRAPVECISFAPNGRVVVGGEDGLPYVVDFTRGSNHAGVHVTSELVFGNIEAVRGLRVSGDLVHMAGDGGVVRKYQL